MVTTTGMKRRPQRTVKAFNDDIAFINEQSKRLGCSAAELIHHICESFGKDIYLQELGESFDILRANPKHFAEFETEQKLWDSTVADGLDHAP